MTGRYVFSQLKCKHMSVLRCTYLRRHTAADTIYMIPTQTQQMLYVDVELWLIFCA